MAGDQIQAGNGVAAIGSIGTGASQVVGAGSEQAAQQVIVGTNGLQNMVQAGQDGNSQALVNAGL